MKLYRKQSRNIDLINSVVTVGVETNGNYDTDVETFSWWYRCSKDYCHVLKLISQLLVCERIEMSRLHTFSDYNPS